MTRSKLTRWLALAPACLSAPLLLGCGGKTQLHTCTATVDLAGQGSVEVDSWGATKATATQAAQVDADILAQLLYFGDAYLPNLDGQVTALPHLDRTSAERPTVYAVTVGSCSASKVRGPRFSATWDGGTAVDRDTPAAALAAARRRTCFQGLAAGLEGAEGAAAIEAAIDGGFQDCWTQDAPSLTQAEGEPAEAVEAWCTVESDANESVSAVGYGARPDEARESAYRRSTLADVQAGQAMASKATRTSMLPMFTHLGLRTAARAVADDPAAELDATRCWTLDDGASLGSVQLDPGGSVGADQQGFLERCTDGEVHWPAPDSLDQVLPQVDQECARLRGGGQANTVAAVAVASPENQAILGHAGWELLASCDAVCRTQIHLPDATWRPVVDGVPAPAAVAPTVETPPVAGQDAPAADPLGDARAELGEQVAGIRTAELAFEEAFGVYVASDWYPRSVDAIDADAVPWGEPPLEGFGALGWSPAEDVVGTYRVRVGDSDFRIEGFIDADGDGTPAIYTATKSLDPVLVTGEEVY
jgi:hypothetical protein